MALTIPEHVGEWTVEDFFRLLPETHLRVEIQDGSLVVSANPRLPHQYAGKRLMFIVAPQLPPGLDIDYELDLPLGRTSLRAPDLLILDLAAISDPGAVVQPGAVVVVVEIVSPSSRRTDRLLKPAEYAGAGIAGFWRLELEPEPLLVAHVLDGDAYRVIGAWGPGEIARIDAPVPVEIPIDDLVRRSHPAG